MPPPASHAVVLKKEARLCCDSRHFSYTQYQSVLTLVTVNMLTNLLLPLFQVNTFRYMRNIARTECAWAQYDAAYAVSRRLLKRSKNVAFATNLRNRIAPTESGSWFYTGRKGEAGGGIRPARAGGAPGFSTGNYDVSAADGRLPGRAWYCTLGECVSHHREQGIAKRALFLMYPSRI